MYKNGIYNIYRGHLLAMNNDWNNLLELIEERYENVELSKDTVESSISLYLIALYELGSSRSLMSDHIEVNEIVDYLVKEAMSKVRAIYFDEKPGHHTSTLGLIYGSLQNINLFLKRDDVNKILREIKSYAFEHLILGGMLMSDENKEHLRFDTLLACVPFGLFEPEDLVLVESVKVLEKRVLMKKTTDHEQLILAWYYVEQGSYDKARKLLFSTTEPAILHQLIFKKLEELGQLKDNFILHRPQGNGNRYEPCIEERFPKIPMDGEVITIQALSVPLDENNPVVLKFNNIEYRGLLFNDYWQFKVPAQIGGCFCEYQLYFANDRSIKTDSFTFTVGKKHTFDQLDEVWEKENQLLFLGNGISLLVENTKDGVQWNIAKSEQILGDLKVSKESWKCLPFKFNNSLQLQLGEFIVYVTIAPFLFSIELPNGKIIKSLERQSIQIKMVNDEPVEVELLLQLSDEKIYGLGERYNAFDQRGEWLDQFVYNQYKDQGARTYMPMPLFYTTGGYGMLLQTEDYSWLDFGKHENGTLHIGVEAKSMNGLLVSGLIKEQVRKINQFNGPAKMVPDWALGPWMSSNNWDSDVEVRRQVELTKHHEIPATVMVIEAWSDEATFYIFNDAEYEERLDGSAHRYQDFSFPEWGRWPNPRNLVDYLHENNLKCILWQIPIIKQITSLHHRQKTLDERYFIENGFGVTHADGSSYRLPEGWFKDSLLMDFSNSAAKEWWFNKRQYLIDDLKVDGFKTDGGEFVFGKDLIFFDERTGAQMRNAYPNDYIKAYYDFAQQNNGITFSRAGYNGAQRFPAHWAGDERSTFNAFKRSILAGLSAGLSGVIFWGWDLGGFSGDVPSAELFIRSTQMATFCPIMQYHAESKAEFNQDRTPWNVADRSGDKRAISLFRYYANVRMSILPYIIQESQIAVDLGEPLMRALILDYESDSNTHEIWDTYMFGRKLLVAPIINEGANSRIIYLPKGRWWNLFEELWVDGGKTISVISPLETIPVYVKENSIIPLNLNNSGVLGDKMLADLQEYSLLTFLIIGECVEYYEYKDQCGNDIVISMKNGNIPIITVKGHIQSITLKFDRIWKNIIINDVESEEISQIVVPIK